MRVQCRQRALCYRLAEPGVAAVWAAERLFTGVGALLALAVDVSCDRLVQRRYLSLAMMGGASRVGFIVVTTIVLAACGGTTSTSGGDPTAAIQIYSQKDPGLQDLLRRQIADFE